MSAYGYERLFSGVPSDFRCRPESRPSCPNVRIPRRRIDTAGAPVPLPGRFFFFSATAGKNFPCDVHHCARGCVGLTFHSTSTRIWDGNNVAADSPNHDRPRVWFSVWSWFSSLRRVPPSIPQVVLSTNHARAGVPDCEDAVYDPALLSRRFRLPTNVRFWLKADIHPHSDLRPLYPRKQTFGREPQNVC